jgi:hypothetical protein
LTNALSVKILFLDASRDAPSEGPCVPLVCTTGGTETIEDKQVYEFTVVLARLAEVTVLRELLSAVKFPVSREFAGNFGAFRASSAILAPSRRANSMASSQIP